MSDQPNSLSRREFTALSLAAGVAAITNASAATSADPGAMTESNVTIETSAGQCDAALVHPAAGAWPGVILFTDVFGLRPTMRDMAKRLAAGGYTVLVPNPFYRSVKPPGLSPDIDFTNPADRARIDALRAPLTADAVSQDSVDWVRFLDSKRTVARRAKIGAFGYCMGGPMTMRAAAANPDRIGAGASFHGGGLVTDEPDSPHLLVPRMKAHFYVGIAMNDDQRQPDAKSKLGDAFSAANLPASIEVYDNCLHGWCVKDMPATPGKPAIYNEAQAERAWDRLVNLFKRALV